MSSSGDTPAASRPDDVPIVDAWEQYGDHLIHPEAFGDYDRFDNLRRDLDLRRQMRDLEARVEPTAARPTGDGEPVTAMGAFLGTLRVADGAYSAYEQVQVWPILRDGAASGSRAPLTASDALRKGVLRVKEGGVADTFVVENRDPAGRSVLILAGDVFHGGRRDRVAREDVLVPPGPERYVRAATTGDPHRRRSLRFGRSDGLAPAGIRALLAQGAGQAEVDDASTASMTWLGSVNEVGSLDFVFENDQLQKRADRYVSVFRQRLSGADVVGFAVTAGSELLGVEVFGDRATFSALGDRALRSYVLEALARPRLVGDSPGRETIVAALGAGRRAATTVTRGDVSAFLDLSSDVLGYGLASGSRIVHAVIFTGASTVPVAGGPGRGRPAPTDGLGPTAPLGGDDAGEPGRGPVDGGGIKPSER